MDKVDELAPAGLLSYSDDLIGNSAVLFKIFIKSEPSKWMVNHREERRKKKFLIINELIKIFENGILITSCH